MQWSRDNNTQNGTFIDLDANPYIIGNVFYVYNDITVYSIDAAFMGGSTATDPGVSASVTLFEMDPAATATDPDYLATILKILSNAEPLCQGSNCDEMITAVGTEINAAFAGEKSVDDALAAAEEQANKIQAE